jgi:uncharacterized LabA/DUF88 family protein
MVKQKAKEKIYAFIDSQNLNLGVKSQGWTLNFGKFRQLLITKYQVKRTYLFIGYIKDNQPLYTYLQSVGYICVFKPTLELKERKGKITVKGNVDAELVLHSVLQFKNYDKAIIVSGDGDFHCLIEYLVSKNKLSKLIVPNKRFSSLLRKFGSYIINVGLFKEKLKMR